MTENLETPDVEIPDEPISHTLLEVWTQLLSNIETSMKEPVTPAQALALTQRWTFLRIKDLAKYHHVYHGLLLDYRNVLEEVLSHDPDAIHRVEDDLEVNRQQYLDALLNWQLLIQSYDHSWDSEEEDAGVLLAAQNDAARFIAGENGLLGHLGALDFQFSEETAEKLQEYLVNAPEEYTFTKFEEDK